MPNLFRIKGSHNEHKVSFSELFFDLVFVYAITQSAHFLITHFTPYGVVQSFMLLLAVWWVWVFTAWVTNWLDPERTPVRLLLFVLMLLGMGLSTAIPQAFDQYGLLFACAYVTMQLGRTLFMVWHSHKYNPTLHNDFVRMSLWFLLAAVFWFSGALQGGQRRTLLWALALTIEYLSASLSFHVPGLGRSDSRNWQISGAHMAERCGLLIIVALGESLLVTGNTFATLTWTPSTVTAFISAFATTVAMWWIYFSLSAEQASEKITHSDRAGHMARLLYTYLHFPIIAAIVVTAAADEFVLAHPDGHIGTATLIATLGGPTLYLLGNSLFKVLMFRSHPHSHYIGLALLALLIPTSPWLSPVWLSVATTLILIGVATRETRVVFTN
jgi:low temperature requirement protein LtrA